MSSWLRTLMCALAAATLALGACSGEKDPEGMEDARPPDDVSDGGVAAAPPGVDLVSGSGTLRGGNVQMDVQIGHGVSQEKTSAGDTTVEGNAPVKP